MQEFRSKNQPALPNVFLYHFLFYSKRFLLHVKMMGDYSLYENNTHLNFTEAKHEIVRNIQFPVYRHVMYQNDPEVSAPKNAFLY